MIDPNRERALNEALELLHFGFRRVIEEPDRVLAGQGLGRSHHRILYFVGRHPGATVGEILAILGISKQALNRPLRDLLQGGWIAADTDPIDRRQKRLRLTPAGVDLEDRLSGDQRNRFDRAFAAAGPAAEAGWRAVMRRLAEP